MFRRVTKGGSYSEETLEEFLAQRGMMNRFFGPMVRAIDKSWKMYPLGLLFGAVFWRWRNLWPLIVAHTIANLIAFLLVGR